MKVDFLDDFDFSLLQGDISFKRLEWLLFRALQKAYRRFMVLLLKGFDEFLMASRDKDRYENLEFKSRTLDTLLGTVTINRRYYKDHETGEYVFLLDERLDLASHDRVSPGLAEMIVPLTTRMSYRDTSARVENLLDIHLSHESCRKLVLEVGRQLKAQEREQAFFGQDEEEGRRQAPELLFLEVDGLEVKSQREGKEREEIKAGICYEDWRKRYERTSKEDPDHVLQDKVVWATEESAGAFWEIFSRLLHRRYDDLGETLVVINGDGASWIREGPQYFENAIYTYDTFHLKERIKNDFAGLSKRLTKEAFAAADQDRLEDLHECLCIAEASQDNLELQKDLTGLRRFLEQKPLAFVDYRKRLRELGYDTEGLRGTGAMESNVEFFAERLKGHRYSWSTGLSGMVKCLQAKAGGYLEQFVDRIDCGLELVPWDIFEQAAGHVIRGLKGNSIRVKRGRMPILSQGSDVAKGFRKISHPQPGLFS